MRKGIILFLLLLPVVTLMAQRTARRDSLIHLIATTKSDTNKFFTILRLAKYFETNNQDSSIYYLEKGKALADSLHYKTGVFDYFEQLSIVSFTKGDYSKAMEETNQSLALARELKDSNLVIISLNHIGIIYGLQLNFEKELESALQISNIIEATKDSVKLSQSYQSLANCYNNLKQYRKAIDYALFSAIIYTKYKKPNNYINRVYATLGQNYEGLQMSDSAVYYYQIAISESKRLSDQFAEGAIYGYMANLYASLSKFKEMLDLSEKSLTLAKALQSRQMMAAALYTAAYANFLNGNNMMARKAIDQAIDIATKDSIPDELLKDYPVLSSIAAREGDYATYIWANMKTDSLHEVTLNNQVIRSTTELETKYETEKKDAQLKLQQAQLQRKSILNKILIGSAITFLLIALLTYRTYRQKRRLQQQRISELEKDRQLVAVDSLLKGQEDERSRLAKELHDGLGGLLSGVKFSLSNMKDNLIVTADNMAVFERSLDMIDTSIKELRRVAHNMMPEMLTKFGLDEALKEYCNMINTTRLLTVQYQSLGMDAPLDKSVEIIIYRIVQELLNNTLKHAKADKCMVQLIREQNRLSVMVEDNGRGFDLCLAEKNSKGAGLANIRNRVEYLKGQLAIHAEPGKGALINIEFIVQ